MKQTNKEELIVSGKMSEKGADAVGKLQALRGIIIAVGIAVATIVGAFGFTSS